MRDFCSFLVFKDLAFCWGHYNIPNSSLTRCVFINILASQGFFGSFPLTRLRLNLFPLVRVTIMPP